MPYWVVFGLKYEKGIVVFEITHKFFESKVLCKNENP